MSMPQRTEAPVTWAIFNRGGAYPMCFTDSDAIATKYRRLGHPVRPATEIWGTP